MQDTVLQMILTDVALEKLEPDLMINVYELDVDVDEFLLISHKLSFKRLTTAITLTLIYITFNVSLVC